MKINNSNLSGGRPGWALTIPRHIHEVLFAHLFPGDEDEHGAIIRAGIKRTPQGLQFLARELVVARDGTDFVPGGKHGYRMLTAEFVTTQVLRSSQEESAYLAIHNHGGRDRVGFSAADFASHERGYPALLDLLDGPPVGALVFARNAAAGSLWLSSDRKAELKHVRLLGPSDQYLYPEPPLLPEGCSEDYHRQALIFGARGQDVLSKVTVGIIGLGGVGSLLAEYLARLGVGNFIIADPDRIELSNIPRVTGSTRWDAMAFLTKQGRPEWLREIGRRLSKPKVKIARRLIRRGNPRANLETLMGDFVDDRVARRFADCDYIFQAADSYQVRLVFNALVHAYLIPGVDLGSKVPVDEESGRVGSVRILVNPVTPTSGCLWCNGHIPVAGLQQEMQTPEERKSQRYVDDERIEAPSVIALNAVSAAHAVNDFMFMVTGLTEDSAHQDYLRVLPRERRVINEEPTKDPSCPHCGLGANSILGRGDRAELSTREAKSCPRSSWLPVKAPALGCRSQGQ